MLFHWRFTARLYSGVCLFCEEGSYGQQVILSSFPTVRQKPSGWSDAKQGCSKKPERSRKVTQQMNHFNMFSLYHFEGHASINAWNKYVTALLGVKMHQCRGVCVCWSVVHCGTFTVQIYSLIFTAKSFPVIGSVWWIYISVEAEPKCFCIQLMERESNEDISEMTGLFTGLCVQRL